MVNHFRTAVVWYNKISYRESDWWCIAYDWAYFVAAGPAHTHKATVLQYKNVSFITLDV